MTRCSALLIDLDGTLMDTVPDLAEAANLLRTDQYLPPLPQERIAQFVGKGVAVLVHRTLTNDLAGKVEEPIHTEACIRFAHHYRSTNGTRSRVFPGVPEGLELLRQADLSLACVTNKPREFTLALLERMGLRAFFQVVVAGDACSTPKPHPGMLWMACERLGCVPSRALFVGDSINDVLAAQAAGMDAVIVATGYHEEGGPASLEQMPGVACLVPTFLEAARWIVGQKGAPEA